jgi:hypothetical protein
VFELREALARDSRTSIRTVCTTRNFPQRTREQPWQSCNSLVTGLYTLNLLLFELVKVGRRISSVIPLFPIHLLTSLMSRYRLFPACQFWTWGPKRLGLPQPFTLLKGLWTAIQDWRRINSCLRDLLEINSQSPFHFASLARVQGETGYYFLNTDLPLRTE